MNIMQQMKLAQFVVAFLAVNAITSLAQATRQAQTALDARKINVDDNTPMADAQEKENVEDRLWSDNNGEFQIRAKLVDFKDNNVCLERDQNQIVIPLSRLSTNDQVYVRNEMQKRKMEHVDEPSDLKKGRQEESIKSGFLTKDEIYTLLLNPKPMPYRKVQGMVRYDGIWTQGKDSDSVLKLLGNPDETLREDRCWKYNNKAVNSVTKKTDDLYITFVKIPPDRNDTGKMIMKVVFFTIGKRGEKIGYDAHVHDAQFPRGEGLKDFCDYLRSHNL